MEHLPKTLATIAEALVRQEKPEAPITLSPWPVIVWQRLPAISLIRAAISANKLDSFETKVLDCIADYARTNPTHEARTRELLEEIAHLALVELQEMEDDE